MSDFIHPDSLNRTSILNLASGVPPPLFGAPAVSLLSLLPTAVVVLATWFWWNPVLPPPGELGPILAIAVEEQPQPQPGGLQIPTTALEEQLPQEEQPPWIGVICDISQVAAAIRAIRDSMEAQIVESVFYSDSDCDSDASGSSGGTIEFIRYPSLDRLQAGGCCIIVPNSISRLEQTLRGLPDTEHKEALGRSCPRLCDALKDPLILNIDPEAFSDQKSAKNDPLILNIDPEAFSDQKSAKNWIIKLKINSKIICMVWDQLDGQNQQLYRELKEECFAELADQLVKNLLNLGRSFSDARWSASHVSYMLQIFDALVDILYNIQQLSFSRFENIHNQITDIYRKMVNHFNGIVEKTAHKNKNSDIHPATEFLILALNFFHHNGVMLQTVLGPRDYIDDLFKGWVSKLKQDAETMFKNEKDRQYLFILNNTWFFWQKRHDSSGSVSNELANRADSLNKEYIKMYLDQYWDPLPTKQCQSSHKFSEDFNSLCSRQRKWKVVTELKGKLREEIINIGRGRNGIFSTISYEEPTNRNSASCFHFWKKPKITFSEFEYCGECFI